MIRVCYSGIRHRGCCHVTRPWPVRNLRSEESASSDKFITLFNLP